MGEESHRGSDREPMDIADILKLQEENAKALRALNRYPRAARRGMLKAIVERIALQAANVTKLPKDVVEEVLLEVAAALARKHCPPPSPQLFSE